MLKNKTTTISLIFALLFWTLIPNVVFSSSENCNWVEVDRFIGGSWNGGTRSFMIDHVEWRIRWNYEPVIDVDLETPILFHIHVVEVGDKIVKLILYEEKLNGTLYLNQQGAFYLAIGGLNIKNYTIIVEQNIDSIPEFPSWIILPFFIVATLVGIVTRNKIRKKGLE